MALIVEDGSIVAGANSYVSLAEADAALAIFNDQGWASLTDPEKETKLAQGCLVVDDEGVYRYDGERVQWDQPRVWPRVEATYWADGPTVPSTQIPTQIKQAQITAAAGLANGTITLGGSGALVKSESVESISVSYFAPSEANADGAGGPYHGLGNPSVTALVAPLLDTDFYDEKNTSTKGVSSAVAARRGPSFCPPSYGGLWDVGMNDTPGVKYPGVGYTTPQAGTGASGGGSTPFPAPTPADAGKPLVADPTGTARWGGTIDDGGTEIDGGSI